MTIRFLTVLLTLAILVLSSHLEHMMISLRRKTLILARSAWPALS